MTNPTLAVADTVIPEQNNVFGFIEAPQGIAAVLLALEHVVAKGDASIYRSAYNGAETLRLRNNRVELESDPLDDGIKHLFGGGIGGSLEEVTGFVRTMSEALNLAGVEHQFEVYDTSQHLVQRIPS